MRLSPRAEDLATPAVREYVEAVLADEPDDFERATALRVLGTIADERSFGIVVEQAAEDDFPEGVARYLCRLGTPDAVALLAECAVAAGPLGHSSPSTPGCRPSGCSTSHPPGTGPAR